MQCDQKLQFLIVAAFFAKITLTTSCCDMDKVIDQLSNIAQGGGRGRVPLSKINDIESMLKKCFV